MDERILGLLKDARRQLEAERHRRTEPIAIVGIGCRFPGGASSPAAFWRLLRDGVDATCEVPPDRWDAEALYDSDPEAPGKAYVKRGGFLERIDGFEPEFFGISPREAVGMDPQQRLLLEVVWEALEDAGIAPERLKGSSTGVWVGLCLDDYARRTVASGDLTRIDAYNTLGNTRSVAAGRIAYVLDLRGPAVQLDTSCSSSLVAIHQACQSLRAGESDLALVGGVNLMSSPEATVALCKLHALSREGRCKSFDAAADGYGRGEGCGMVVMKRVTEAQASGDRIYAVIRGTSTNHDGRSNGLTAPNGLAQEAVIRAALANAALESSAVDYVEAHGTGTLLGDPIEVLALSRVYGEGRSIDDPLHLGALKTNFGHLEGAAGVAGLIKLALCLDRNAIPPHLHFHRPNPKIPWERLPIRVVTELKDWPRTGKPRIAGVSSFGMSGTNAHVLLEEAPLMEPGAPAPSRSAELIVLSAKTPQGLAAVAKRMREHLESSSEAALGDVAYSLVTTRTLMEHRLSISTPTRQALLGALGKAEAGDIPSGCARGKTRAQRAKVAWLFAGQGAQQLGMGRTLYAEWGAFREALDDAFSVIDPLLERPLRQVIWADPASAEAALLDQTGYTQPALFALEWALAQLWRSWGVEPDLALGHSIGEITAACWAGVFSLPDAARLVCERARLMQALPFGGAMVSIAAPESQVAAAVAPVAATVSIAAINGPASTVVTGRETDVLAIAERFAASGIRTKRLSVSHAFHSPLMEPMLDAFRAVAQTVSYHTPRLPLISNLSGQLAGDEVMTPHYWVRHVREAVRFSPGLQALYAAGATLMLEIGPKATLLGLVPASVPDEDVVLLPSLRAGRSESEAMLEALGGWVAQGGRVDWPGVFPLGGRRVELPSYPWQHQRYWIDPNSSRADEPGANLGLDAALKRLASLGMLSEPARAALPDILSALARDRASDTEREIATYSHELTWRAIAPLELPTSAGGTWVILGPKAESLTMAAAFERAGFAAHIVNDLDGLRALVRTVGGLSGAVHILGKGARDENQVLAAGNLLASCEGSALRAWWITQGAVGTSPADPPTDPHQAVVWGLGRTFAVEHPRTWGGLVDLPAQDLLRATADRLVGILVGAHGEDQLAVRGQSILVPRLQQARLRASQARLSMQGTILITGGLGAVGLNIARWLARRGARHLMLVGRQGRSTRGVDRMLDELGHMGTKVAVAAADVCDRVAMTRVLRSVSPEAPLTAVFHAAGVNDETFLENLTPQRLQEVLAVKREGTLILDELTRDRSLEAFVCFSSIAGIWGSGKQAAYAAANAFLDAWVQAAAASGRPATSIAWGPWAGGGMADPKSLVKLAGWGVRAMPPEMAIAALEQVLADGRSHTIVADVDWEKFRFESWGPRKLLDEIPNLDHGARPSDPAPPLVAEALAVLRQVDRKAYLRGWIAEQCAAVLGQPDTSKLDLQRGFFDVGFDSLMVVELRRRLERGLGLRLSAGTAFSHPNIASLVEHLLREFDPALSGDAPRQNPVAVSGEGITATLESDDDVVSFINSKFEAGDEQSG